MWLINMAKKNLIILLLIPFLIALLGVVTISTTFSFIDNDILGITWDYNETEAFKLSNSLYPLNATGINEKNYPAGKGNGLVWNLRNSDSNDLETHAEIIKNGSKYYLKTISSGSIIITCQNEKGNVFKSMVGIIYAEGAVLINNKNKASQSNIDNTIYFGEFDINSNNNLEMAVFYFDCNVVPSNNKDNIMLYDKTDNINVDLINKKVTILESGYASFTIGCGKDSLSDPGTYSFYIVKNGVNVYSYSDLLYCTNDSENGEIVVLQKSFESLSNIYKVDEFNDVILDNGNPIKILDDVCLFGNYNFKTKSFNFNNEIYKFKTTYNSNFIDQWNKSVKKNNGTNYISSDINVGLRIQKDFYGNGYTINLHNLTYPKEQIEQTDSNGITQTIPQLTSSDIFKGPLPFYSLGDPNGEPLVEALGQDNIGFYVDGNNILINDVNFKNCDFGNMLSNLEYSGTVLEVNGNNVKITNSRLQNGKNVLRSFSNENLVIDNCLLQNARNFLITIGSNDYISTSILNGNYEFKLSDGTSVNSSVSEFLSEGELGDTELNKYLLGSFENKDLMKKSLLSIHNVFNNSSLINNKSGGSITINDTLFYRSGVTSIAIESMFNGSFLYNGTPSLIKMMLEVLSKSDDKGKLTSLIGDNLSGVSYPVTVNISGKTSFYDYKNSDEMDISGLITENISKVASQFISSEQAKKINIDQIFPIKSYLFSNGYNFNNDGKNYINVPIAFYGGGLNLSKINIDNLDIKDSLTNEVNIDLLDNYLNMEGINFDEIMDMISNGNLNQAIVPLIKNVMLKCVTVVIGYEPFRFIYYNSNDLYDKTPQVSDLILNSKGGSFNEEN